MINVDYIFKVVIVGDSGVGKSSLISRLVDNRFNQCYVSTIGVDFTFKSFITDTGKCVKLHIWDTAGQERFRSIATQYYRNADAVIIVYDISDEETFRNVGMWYSKLKEIITADIPILLIGNKNDITRCVSIRTAEKFCMSRDINYIETSVKDDKNVYEAFKLLAEQLSNIKHSIINNKNDITITTIQNKPRKKCC